MDFDDLLILADKLLKEHRDVREAWQQRFRYITVDEFQDTNSLQMSLLGHLVGPEHNVCVVGDDDQSIYWLASSRSAISWDRTFFSKSLHHQTGRKLPLHRPHPGHGQCPDPP